MPHLHGGEVPPELDGGPDAWFTSEGNIHGHGYYTNPNVPVGGNAAVYTYPNTQEAAPIWFHDHTLGATRLNVYAGLAGAYLIDDPALNLPAGLAPYGLNRIGQPTQRLTTVPLVLQDRMFDTNGQLFFPAAAPGDAVGAQPRAPLLGTRSSSATRSWSTARPGLSSNVEPKRYRFLLLNGSNARAYEMFLTNPKTKANGPAM